MTASSVRGGTGNGFQFRSRCSRSWTRPQSTRKRAPPASTYGLLTPTLGVSPPQWLNQLTYSPPRGVYGLGYKWRVYDSPSHYMPIDWGQYVWASPAVPAVPTVMVVDDSLTVRKITSRLLTREGYQVVLAKDGVDALEQLLEVMPDVIISDIEMPRMDGFDLVRNIRADKRLSALPVIMITSRTAEKHRNYALEIGASHYLGKPYDEDELLSLIAGYIRAKQAS